MSDKHDKSLATTSDHRPRRWDPFAVFSEIESEMDRVFGRRFPLIQPLRRYMGGSMSSDWTPSADVYEHNGSLVIKAELPGVKKEDLDVTVDKGNLVIRGERRTDEEVREEDYYRMERFHGTFYRSFPLPESIDEDAITAEFHDGVLEVRVPRPTSGEDETPTKKIEIK